MYNTMKLISMNFTQSKIILTCIEVRKYKNCLTPNVLINVDGQMIKLSNFAHCHVNYYL